MNNKTPQEIALEKIKILSLFRDNIYRWFNGQCELPDAKQLRGQIEQDVQDVRSIVAETCCLRLVPKFPPSQGKLVVRDYDPFNCVLENSYHGGVSFIPTIIEIIEDSITVLKSSKYLAKMTVNLEKN
jgi:hypothetical protein